MNELIKHWPGEMVICHFDRPTGSWIYVGVQSSRLGPATGGTRMMHYRTQDAALHDCLNLAQGMTLKFALANFPRGGGKAVIAVPAKLDAADRLGLLGRYGELIRRLGGIYRTGPDIGTSSEDMDVIAKAGAPFVHSRTVENGGAGNSSALTALGAYRAIEATFVHLDGAPDWANRTVLIQGLGSVGRQLLELLMKKKVRLLVNDTDPAARMKFAGKRRVAFVEASEVYATACDIFSPCALGGVLNRETIPQLRCRAVVGAANNQLATRDAAHWLQKRGILYAPDFAVNVGGALGITGIEALQWSPARAAREVGKIGRTISRIYRLAAAENTTTAAAAEKLAAQNLARAKTN